jgi:hypothetical protein
MFWGYGFLTRGLVELDGLLKKSTSPEDRDIPEGFLL